MSGTADHLDDDVREPASHGSAKATAGQLLREAREARGLHIAALAAMLKVPQSKLEMLEADRWRELPDATFARALAKAVCRTLKIEAAPVLALLPREQERELNVSLGLNTPYRDRGEGSGTFSGDALRKPVVWAPALLLIAAAAVYFAPPLHWSEAHSDAAAAATAASGNEPTDASGVALAQASAPDASAAPAGPAASSDQTPSQAVVASPLATTPAPTAASAPVRSATAASASTALAAVRPASQAASAVAPLVHVATGDELPLTLKTTSETWVQIIDASGQTVVSRLIPAGSEQVFAGAPPLKVTIGNVSGAQLLLRGQPVDLATRAQNNVARLEVH